MKNVLWFDEINAKDTEKVGGKSANLGELSNEVDVPVLPGFATTADAYDTFIHETDLREKIERLLDGLDTDDVNDLQRRGEQIRSLIKEADMPQELRESFTKSYEDLEKKLGVEDPAVAVRSSATAEDLPGASFAGQQETYLNVEGKQDLIKRVKDCFASLFTNRAISYREDKGFSHFDVKLSAVVQKMGRSDIGAAGVMFTMDPDSGFENVVTINGSYGLGEYVVLGEVNPDEFTVFKENLGIIEKSVGDKSVKLVRDESEENDNKEVDVPKSEQEQFCVTDNQVKELAKYALRIEDHYGKPMDIEWVYDGQTKEMYIVQARPETVQAEKDENVIEEYSLNEESDVVLEGSAIGSKIGQGKAHVLDSPKQIDQFEEDQVLVTDMTDPDWEPIMKKAGAIITNKGGRTSHAAIVSRELGVPAVIGTENATSKLKDGQEVTVDCSSSTGKIWEGQLDFNVDEHHLDEIPETETDVQVNIGEPSEAFHIAQLPVNGVGLAREEFIISSHVGEHPLSLIEDGREDEYVEALRSGLGKIGAAFYPDQVVIRLSDFKSDEYADLEGGADFEPDEANPMLGFRGASRYYDEVFQKAFELECEALRRVIDELELDNITVMVPFCRTVDEGKNVRAKMKEYGLDQGDIDVYAMAEIPSNIIRADEFAEVFDGFSVGTNDLTQLTLGVDRNSDKLKDLFDERDPAVKKSIKTLINKAHRNNAHVGICGDAPSTHDGYADFLVHQNIDAISVSPDVALETILKVADAEEKVSNENIEFSVSNTVGQPAGDVYEALKDQGKMTARKMLDYTDKAVDKDSINQAIGWLAKEGKLTVEHRDGEIRYDLETEK
ncbi:phosphoenolpyruvate synthase [Candidatus Nanohalococcus occultus]|uniref:Phosphoenolpyruvate synthase n=1 Tax=Candidatus Nanohalococcus occultus TaxID=2978047 RepID=A0ABY8CDJ5_9ARCH|nr:Phosphoenolpyruvate synthase/pyruvate phosphate dikinase [Candidatus Nanohaloarchaeota archaeon SVXNc]